MEKLKVAVFLLSVLAFTGCSEEDDNFQGVTRTPAQQLAFDIIRIEGYLEENDLTGFTQTPEGLFYKVEELGNGIFPQTGQTAFIEYIGTTIERTVFDQTTEGVPIEVVIGSTNLEERVIEGWNLGIPLFQDDGSGTLIIPSTLAFGSEGFSAAIPPIEPNAILIFDIKIAALR
ncbi:MAG: FKBP-type peptidyl-prolyl cis-trans isomerase [Cyclobacteriaceae bacterium]